jgi:hypothetical protein
VHRALDFRCRGGEAMNGVVETRSSNGLGGFIWIER